MHKPESILEKKAHKILWDFELQTDFLMPARRSYLMIISKKAKSKKKANRTCRIVDFSGPQSGNL